MSATATPVPLEYGEHCASARQQAHDSVPPPGMRGPVLLKMPIVPMPIPPRVKGVATVTMKVDSAGRLVRSSLQMSGISDRDYLAKLRKLLVETLEFRPATIGRCGVAGRYELRYDFGR